MKVSIVIVNYNVKYFLEQCLCSVRAALQGMDAEVWVVDNCSADGSVGYLRPLFPEVHFIENKDNPGFAKANNQAIRASRGEYVLLLNPDTVIGEEIIRSLCFFMDGHPEAGGVGVKMLDGHGIFLPESKRCFPSPWVSFCKIFGLSKCFPRSPLFARYSLPYLDENRTHRVDVLAGAFMFLRREALDKAGLFDESFFMYGEDIDLSYRIVKAGYANYYLPERILHYKGESVKQDDARYIKAFYGAMPVFYRKYYPDAGRLASGVIRLAVRLKAALSVLGGRMGLKRKPRVRHRRLLALCRAERFEELKAACVERMPELEQAVLWNIDEERAVDAVCRRNLMRGFTDWVFCYPDMRFEQMFLLMDRMAEKKITYHIYNKERKRLM